MLGKGETMINNFKEDARKVLVRAKNEMFELRHPYVGSEHLLLAILKGNNEVALKLKEQGLTYQKLKDEIIDIIGIGTKESDWFLYTPLLKRIIETASIDSRENNNGEVTIEHLFTALLEEGEGVAVRIMIGMDIDIDELYNEFSYRFISNKKGGKNKKLLVEELGIDLTEKAASNLVDPVIGRMKEINRVLEILSRRTKNNPILIGEPGVGKTAIVEQLARLIVNDEIPNLRNKRIISLNMAALVAGTKYRGEFEERMNKMIREIEQNDNIILFIDEIHTLVGAGGAEGAIDASNIFKPALARGKIHLIGATTTQEYKKYIEADGALERRFQKVLVEEPEEGVVKEILMNLKEIYESFHHVILKENIIEQVIRLSKKYIHDRKEPDASIDILDEVCAKVSLKENKNTKKYKELKKNYLELKEKKNQAIIKNDFKAASRYKEEENKIVNDINVLELELYKDDRKEVMLEEVAEVIHMKTGIPVYEILKDNNRIIEEIENTLTKTIVGQEHALKELINVAKKIKLGFFDHQCYSFLFAGPSGVGKTELARTFGNSLVGKNVIRLDMSEYSEAHSISKIIGSPPGYVGYMDYKNISEEIRNHPYSVLILDELEKAHPNIINLFFQILDNGKIKDASGNVIYFDNVIIIMTSNIGFDDIQVGFQPKEKSVVTSKLKEYFSLPFINRIDNIITFNALNKEDITTIIYQKLEEVKKKYQSKIKVNIKNDIIEDIITESHYSDYGARKIDKIIKDSLENKIIDAIIEEKKIITLSTIKDTIAL